MDDSPEARALHVVLSLLARNVTGLSAQIALLNNQTATRNRAAAEDRAARSQAASEAAERRATREAEREAERAKREAAKAEKEAAQATEKAAEEEKKAKEQAEKDAQKEADDAQKAFKAAHPITTARTAQIDAGRTANADLKEALDSGQFLEQQRELNKLAKERAGFEAEAVRQQRVARFGAVGGGIANAAASARESPAGAIAGALARSFGAVLSPLARLSTFLDQTTSGFGVFSMALRVFASAVAPIFLPIFLVLAAALISLSEVIWRNVLPHLEDWMEFIIANAIPAIEGLVEAAKEFADWVKRNVERVSDTAGGAAGVGEAIVEGDSDKFAASADRFWEGILGRSTARGMGLTLDRRMPGGSGTGAGDYQDGVSAGGEGDYGPPGAGQVGPDGRIVGTARPGQPPAPAQRDRSDLTDPRNSLRLMIESFRRQAAPQASFAGLAERSRQLQISSLNRDPLQALMDKHLLEVINVLNRVEAKLDKLDKPKSRLGQREGG